jgi:hypothetical protein
VKRRAFTLVVLAAGIVLVAAAGGLVAWHPWKKPAAPAAAGSAAPPPTFVTLLSVSQELLRSIALVGPAGTIELDNAGGQWRISKPAVLRVKQDPMNDLLYSIANLSSERVIEENPQDLSVYGLKPPQVTVRITLTSGDVKEVFLGNLTPAGDTYYLMVKGDPRVFTVREHHGTYFHYVIRDLWEGSLTPVDGAILAYLRLRKAGALVVELRKTPDLFASDIEFRGTTMSVVYPYVKDPRPVDSGFVGQFVQALGSLQGTYAVDAGQKSLAAYGLASPSYELELRDDKGVSLHVFIGRQEANVLYVKFETDPTVYAADPALLSILDVTPAQFVNKYALIVKLDTVNALSLDAGGVHHVLQVRRATPGSEEGAAWLVDGRAVAEQTWKSFYVAAISLQTDSLFDGALPGGAPALTMTFTLNTGAAETFSARFVPYSQEFFAVVKNGRSDILVNRQQVKFLLQQLDALVAAAKG